MKVKSIDTLIRSVTLLQYGKFVIGLHARSIKSGEKLNKNLYFAARGHCRRGSENGVSRSHRNYQILWTTFQWMDRLGMFIEGDTSFFITPVVSELIYPRNR